MLSNITSKEIYIGTKLKVAKIETHFKRKSSRLYEFLNDIGIEI